ncbi:MAG: hypothetical protein ACFB0C_02045 [Leptolyngbyaceae cyanobacterium]
MKQAVWQRGNRRYAAMVQQNLFGEWVLHREWWGTASHCHGRKTSRFTSYDAAAMAFTMVANRRASRGYQPLL